jgi:hypothetical protein
MFFRNVLQLATLTCLAMSPALPSQLKRFSGPIGGEVAVREPASNTTVHVRDVPSQDFTYNVYCGCGITLDAASTNAVASDIGSQDWDIPINTGWAVAEGDVVGSICNYGPTEYYGFRGALYLDLVQHPVSTVCGSFIAGIRERQYSDPSNAVFGGYMRYTGQSINDICQAARASGSWVNTDGWSSLPFICWDVNK